jgi:hypothetical protein
LADVLRQSAASGVVVACHVYADEKIEGVHTLNMTDSDLASIDWPGQQISVVVDSQEHLLGLLGMDMETVHEAVWSSSNFLSCMQHNHLLADLLAVGPRSRYSGPADSADEVLKSIMLTRLRPPGLKELIRRYGPGSAAEEASQSQEK